MHAARDSSNHVSAYNDAIEDPRPRNAKLPHWPLQRLFYRHAWERRSPARESIESGTQSLRLVAIAISLEVKEHTAKYIYLKVR